MQRESLTEGSSADLKIEGKKQLKNQSGLVQHPNLKQSKQLLFEQHWKNP